MYARWTATYTVTFDVGGGSYIAPHVTSGSAVRPDNPEKPGFIFLDWYTEAVSGTVWDFNTPITADITLYARWTAVPPSNYTVTFDVDGGSYVTPQVTSGSAVRPDNPEKAGFVFLDW